MYVHRYAHDEIVFYPTGAELFDLCVRIIPGCHA
uniref:Uncharacterized protein n=1 Tax=Anguilla anguilla TaxID=7936 RepID=A0A0E9UTW7_ANGAN